MEEAAKAAGREANLKVSGVPPSRGDRQRRPQGVGEEACLSGQFTPLWSLLADGETEELSCDSPLGRSSSSPTSAAPISHASDGFTHGRMSGRLPCRVLMLTQLWISIVHVATIEGNT